MKELEKILLDLKKQGYEQVTIEQLFNWIYNIRSNARVKRLGLND